MTEEIQEIERLIKQSGELADSLIRLAQKLRERHQRLLHQINNGQAIPHDETYVTVRRMVANGTITPQEAIVKLLQVAVIHRTVTPAEAVEQVAKLLHPDLPVSRRIELRETTKAAFEAYAEAFGATGRMIRTPDEVAPVLKEALDHSGPTIVGVPVDYSDNHKLFEMVIEDRIH